MKARKWAARCLYCFAFGIVGLITALTTDEPALAIVGHVMWIGAAVLLCVCFVGVCIGFRYDRLKKYLKCADKIYANIAEEQAELLVKLHEAKTEKERNAIIKELDAALDKWEQTTINTKEKNDVGG